LKDSHVILHRKERILAVSKQIYNFLQWRKDYLKGKNHVKSTSISKVYVIGKAEDIRAIQKRIDELDSNHKNDDIDVNKSIEGCKYMPDVLLEDLLNKHEIIHSKVSHACYLSPDADQSLSAAQNPPQVVIVGMLVDRKVQPNRSKSRAKSVLESQKGLTMTDQTVLDCAKLPLDALNVSDLKSDEALNIDTVMEMIQRWWVNCSKEGPSKKAFVDASARSMLTHRNRHPVRTIHGGASDNLK
jgi:hypothetical protein